MRDRDYSALWISLSLLMMGLLLAFFLIRVLEGFSVEKSKSSAAQSTKTALGLAHLEASAISGSTVPLSSFSNYDQAHGTKLHVMASALPSVSASQAVSIPDFEQLQAAIEQQIELPQRGGADWWSILLAVATVFIAPIFTKIMANITDDFFYPKIRGVFERRQMKN